MTLTLFGFGIRFLVLSLVCLHMARKHADTLAYKLLRPEVIKVR